MADNTAQNATDTIATDDVTTLNGGASSGVKVQRVKAMFGDDGTATDVSATNPLPTTPGANGGALLTTSGAIAAAATGTVGPLSVGTQGNGTFTIKNTVAANAWAGTPVVVFEQSDDNTSWGPILVVRGDTGQAGSTFTLGANVANAELQFDCALEGVSYIRARVTTGPTTNGLTIVIAAGGMPFPQGNTVLNVPLDGHKATYSAATGSAGGQAVVTTGTNPILTLDNTSTTKVLRVVHVRVEITAGTASMGQYRFLRLSSAFTGGTSLGYNSDKLDSASPTAAGSVKSWTVAPTGGGAVSGEVAFRRVWCGLATATGSPGVMDITFGTGPYQAVILRPGQGFACVVATSATTPSMTFDIQWTEEPV